MKKIILVLIAIAFSAGNIFAQKITSAAELKTFYVKYFMWGTSVIYEQKQDSLVAAYCTKELYAAWNREVNLIGLYDPFTNGALIDDLSIRTLDVRKENDYYVVSYHFMATGMKRREVTETVIIYVNQKGKISHTKRPSDGMLIP